MARKKVKAEEPKSDMTVAMFLSLMILILAFFIVLVSMSRIEVKKTEEALKSINSTFGVMPGGKSPFFAMGGVLSEAQQPMDQMQEDYRQIKDLAYRTQGQDKINLQTDGARRIVVLDNDILFDSESIVLKPEAEPFLKGLAAIIEGSEYWVEVAGYTDDIEPRPGGVVDNNWALSGYRALAVARFLESQGVARRRLSAFGYGSINPIRPNDSGPNRAQNHRVEIVLDQTLAADVEELRLQRKPGQFHYRGFTFDLFNRPAPDKKPEGKE